MTVMLRGIFSVKAGAAAAVCLVIAAGLGSFLTARACDVPVHRYILQRWERDLYDAYYFYRGKENPADREVNQFLDGAANSFGSHTNLTFRAADVDRFGEVQVETEKEGQIWNQYGSNRLPFHLLLSPRGTVLFRGRMSLPMAKAVIQSPMRTRIAAELSAGKGGLVLLLAGRDETENQRAEQAVRWVLSRARKEHGVDVGCLRLSRKQPGEEWLVRFLLDAVEHSAGDEQCVVFGICGRGRVLAAYTGAGINRRNIVECVGIMNGDCSCNLWMESPGMDLLTDWDWEGAIANLPPVTVEPLRSVLLGFDDSNESSGGVRSEKLDPELAQRKDSLLGVWMLRGMGIMFGILAVITASIGLMLIRRRKEL